MDITFITTVVQVLGIPSDPFILLSAAVITLENLLVGALGDDSTVELEEDAILVVIFCKQSVASESAEKLFVLVTCFLLFFFVLGSFFLFLIPNFLFPISNLFQIIINVYNMSTRTKN